MGRATDFDMVEGQQEGSSIALTENHQQSTPQAQTHEISTRRGADSIEQKQKQGQEADPCSLKGHEAERDDPNLQVFWGMGGETVIEFGIADARRIVSAAERHAEGEAKDGPETAQAEFIAGVLVLEVLRIGLPLLWRLLYSGVTTREELFGVLLGEGSRPCWRKSLYIWSNTLRNLLLVVDSDTQEEFETCEAVAQLLRGIIEASAHDRESGQNAHEKEREQNNIANTATAAGGPTRNIQNACCTSPSVFMVQRKIDKSTDIALVRMCRTQDCFQAVATMFLAPETFYEQRKKYWNRQRNYYDFEKYSLPGYLEKRAKWDPAAVREWLLSSPLIGKYFVEQGYASFLFWRDVLFGVSNRFELLQIVLQTPGLDCHDLSTPDGLARMVVDMFRDADASADKLHETIEHGSDVSFECIKINKTAELLRAFYKAILNLGARMIPSNVANPCDWNWHGAADPLLRVSLLAVQNLGRNRADRGSSGETIETMVQVQHSMFFTEVVSALLDFELENASEGGLPLFTGASKGAALTVLLVLRIAAQRATEYLYKFFDEAICECFPNFSVDVVKRSAMALVSAGADLSDRLFTDIAYELRECEVYFGPPPHTDRDGVRLCELRPLPLAAILGDRELISALEQNGAA